MNRLPGGLFVVDTKKEAIAVAEANKLNIPVFGIVDTNSDPDPIDYPIPANDDAFKSISLIVHTVTDGVLEGQAKSEIAGDAEQQKETVTTTEDETKKQEE
jgi:small subunit ribosomal protein S2